MITIDIDTIHTIAELIRLFFDNIDIIGGLLLILILITLQWILYFIRESIIWILKRTTNER